MSRQHAREKAKREGEAAEFGRGVDESGEAEEVWVGNGVEDEVGFEETKVVGVKREEFSSG